MKTIERKILTKPVSVPKKTLDNSLPDLSQHPVVVKKVDKARETLRKSPFPNNLKGI